MSNSILTSLRYLDELRLDPETEVARDDGSNVELLTTPMGDQFTLCHLSVIFPFTFGDTVPYKPIFEDAATIALAAHHLNTGNGDIVPQVEGLHEKCNVRFSVEFADTQSNKGVAVGHVVEQTNRDDGQRSPCGFIGAYSSSVSMPTGLVTGILGYPQISGGSTSAELDDKALYPLFARTIPSDHGNAIPVLQYMRNVLDISHLAIIHTNSAYPLSYIEGLRRAAAEYAPDMIFHQVPIENTQASIESAVGHVKTTGVRFVFALISSQELHDAVMSEAYKQKIAGTGVHNWLFADGFSRAIEGRSFEKGSPLHLSYRGSGQFAVSGGIAGIPTYDRYIDSVSELANAEDLEYIGSLFPKQNYTSYGDSPPFIDDPTFLKATTSAFSPFMYEATIALGLSACSASNETTFFSGKEHYDQLVSTTFNSMSGNVYFDPATGSRDPNSAFYKILNSVEEEFVDTDGKKRIKFNRPPTDIFLGGVWESREKYVFNDGTTNLPVDWVPPPEESQRLQLPGGLGIAAAGVVFIGLILFLFYEHKRKESDGIWKVKNEELKYSDPLEVIGRGTFGLVVLAEYRGTKVAVKRVIPPRTLKHRNGKRNSDDKFGTCSGYHSHPRATGSHSNSGSGAESENTSHTEAKSSTGVAQGTMSTHRNTLAMKSKGQVSFGLSSIRFGVFRSSMSENATWKRLKKDFKMEMRHLSMLRHPCVTTVMGAVLEKGAEPMLVMEFMEHGSLYDLLHNETMVIEGELLLPILRDISQGVRFLHSATPQVIHGDLKAANILVDGKFRAKVADFGLSQKKALGGTGTPFWMAPELLRYESSNTSATDVYSFGVILYEVYSRQDPYEGEDSDAVLRAVADRTIKKRPPIPESMPLKVRALMADCLDDEAEKRPTFEELDVRLNRVDPENVNPHNNVGSYRDMTNTISLFDIFPRHIAEALRDGRAVEPEHRECVTIFFCDIVGFTSISSELPPGKVAELLNRLYSKLDLLSQKHDVFKVETIGDSYMAVTNLIKDQKEDHVKRIAMFAIDAVAAANGTYIDIDDPSKGSVNIRAGFHCGSVVADVVGKKNPRYCLFGDTVNTASRMESYSKSNRIQCSEAAAQLLKQQCSDVALQSRGIVAVKGKGEMTCYWVNEDSSMEKTELSPKKRVDFSSSNGLLGVLLEERSGYTSDRASDVCERSDDEELLDLEAAVERAP